MPPKSPAIAANWGRFPWWVERTLRQHGITLSRGLDTVLLGNIPGGGMSRSASLTLNLILSLLDADNVVIDDPMQVALRSPRRWRTTPSAHPAACSTRS